MGVGHLSHLKVTWPQMVTVAPTFKKEPSIDGEQSAK